jgi:transposase
VGHDGAPAFWRRLDGLNYMAAEKLSTLPPDALYALAGIRSLDEIAISTGVKGELPPDCRYLIRKGRGDRGRTYWQLVARGCDGLAPIPQSTGVLHELGSLEGQVGAVRILARGKRAWLFGADWPREAIGAVRVADVLDWYMAIHIDDEPQDGDDVRAARRRTAAQVERDESAANTRKTAVGKIARLRSAFVSKRLADIRLYGPLKLYNDGRRDRNDSTRNGDLTLFKSAVNELVRLQGGLWREFAISEKVPSGSARAKPDLSVDQLAALLYACGGIVVSEDGWPQRDAGGALVLAPLDIRAARAIYGVAIVTALVTAGRKGRILRLEYGVSRPCINIAMSKIDLGGAARNRTKPAGPVPFGGAAGAFFEAARRRAASVGTTRVLHKVNGGGYKGLNRKIFVDLVRDAGLDAQVFHAFKGVCVDAIAAAGHSVIEMSDYTHTRVETLQANYRSGAIHTRLAVARSLDRALGGSPEAWEQRPDRSLGGAALGRNEGLGQALRDLSETLDRTFAESANARACRHVETERSAACAIANAGAPVVRSRAPEAPSGNAVATGRRLSAPTMADRRELSDAEWAAFASLARMRPGKGQSFDESVARRALNGMVRLAVTGESWKALPPIYGDRSTVRRAHVRWLQNGVFEAARARALLDQSLSLSVSERAILASTCEGLAALRGRPTPASRTAPIDTALVFGRLTDGEWELCAEVFSDKRGQLDALLWLAETRRPLKSLPEEFGDSEAARWRRRHVVENGALDALVALRGGVSS